EVVVVEDPGARRADVHRGGHRIGRGQLTADLGEARDGGPDLSGLTERAHFNGHDPLRVAQAKLHRNVHGFAGSPEVGELLPSLRLREELPQALSHLSPNIPRFHHVSLAPGLSASAETLRTIESACQHKTYAAAREQFEGWYAGLLRLLQLLPRANLRRLRCGARSRRRDRSSGRARGPPFLSRSRPSLPHPRRLLRSVPGRWSRHRGARCRTRCPPV